MKNKDSVAHEQSSPKPSFHARNDARTTQADSDQHQVRRVIASSTDDGEKFDVPHHVQYY